MELLTINNQKVTIKENAKSWTVKIKAKKSMESQEI